VWSNFQLGELFFEEGKFSEALKYYKKVEDVLPNNGKALYQIGFAYQKIQDFVKAKEYFEKVEK
jgi:tetratricopeptide (TPR) repeat protein